LVVVLDLVQRFAPDFKAQLRQHGTSPETNAVLQNVVAKGTTDGSKHLETMICSFTSASYVAPFGAPMLIFHVAYTAGALRRPRIFTDVAIVRFDALIRP
jgi:hypothetical protein